MECVACLDVVERRRYAGTEELSAIKNLAHQLFIKLQAMRHSLKKGGEHALRRRSMVPGQPKP